MAFDAGCHRRPSFETHPDLADLQLVAETERRHALDPPAVDVRAIRAVEVLDVPRLPAIGQDGVVSRRERVVDDDGVVDVPTERGDDVETVRQAGSRLPGRRLEDDQTAGSIRRFTRRRPQVAQQRPDDPVQEEIDEAEEQKPDGPQDEEEAVHQSGAPATSTTSAVSPTSSRSPTPSTTSTTGTPLTREPFVLPRSA